LRISAPNAANYLNVNVTNSVATFEFFQSGVADHVLTIGSSTYAFDKNITVGGTMQVTGTFRIAGTLLSAPAAVSPTSTAGGILELWGATGQPTFINFNEQGVANRGSLGYGGGSATLAYRSGATTMSDGTQRWAIDNTGGETLFGKLINYNNVNTAGWGVPAIYGSGRSTAQTGDVASVATYTCGAADGSFMISCNANCTAFTAGVMAVQCTYTDETNTARTLVLSTSNITGTIGTSFAATGAFEGLPLHIRVKASRAITVKTVGTTWTGTYNIESIIQQIA
jgi:hypothetical protein